jgi:hypothetical protein
MKKYVRPGRRVIPRRLAASTNAVKNIWDENPYTLNNAFLDEFRLEASWIFRCKLIHEHTDAT